MIWLKRRLAGVDYIPYMDHIQKLLFDNAPLYQEFIMVSTKTADPDIDDFYVGLPNAALAQGFDGFTKVAESDLPKAIDVVHVADAGKEPFQSRFGKRA
jgi:hypothetical protein